ncbi:hypothetical protein PybrP1_000347 [[Pythium] brassicae (nom. inval.)]|nr:hypothetical protein PybrP1_000347 [[Pythium] brassicae (nom. inval.)]
MAATACIHGEDLLLVNVYASMERDRRESLFETLSEVIAAHAGPTLASGDFNCTTLPAADRSNDSTASSHFSPALHRTTEACRLEDALLRETMHAEEAGELEVFAGRHCTYHYTSAAGSREASRLDRWYVTAAHEAWVKEVERRVPAQPTDRNAAVVRLVLPKGAVRVRR